MTRTGFTSTDNDREIEIDNRPNGNFHIFIQLTGNKPNDGPPRCIGIDLPNARGAHVAAAVLEAIGVEPATPYMGPAQDGDDAFTRREPTALEYAALWLNRHITEADRDTTESDGRTWVLAAKLYNQKRTLFMETWGELPLYGKVHTEWFDIARLAETTIQHRDNQDRDK